MRTASSILPRGGLADDLETGGTLTARSTGSSPATPSQRRRARSAGVARGGGAALSLSCPTGRASRTRCSELMFGRGEQILGRMEYPSINWLSALKSSRVREQTGRCSIPGVLDGHPGVDEPVEKFFRSLALVRIPRRQPWRRACRRRRCRQPSKMRGPRRSQLRQRVGRAAQSLGPGTSKIGRLGCDRKGFSSRSEARRYPGSLLRSRSRCGHRSGPGRRCPSAGWPARQRRSARTSLECPDWQGPTARRSGTWMRPPRRMCLKSWQTRSTCAQELAGVRQME